MDGVRYGGDEREDAACGATLGGRCGGGILGLPPRGGRGGIGGDIYELARSSVAATMISPSGGGALRSVREGYAQRVAADPSFPHKSALEVVLAVVGQCVAEWGSRGRDRLPVEIDFVFARQEWSPLYSSSISFDALSFLSFVCTRIISGKYYSMWKVAKTVGSGGVAAGANGGTLSTWRDNVPTNAFQPTLFDGRTAPSLSSRFLAIVLPMPELFRAGAIASAIGYGLTSALIGLRAIIAPHYVVATSPVPVHLAVLFTGIFVATVSNVRYQVLQGIVEPYMIDGAFSKIERALCKDRGGGRASGRISGRLKLLRNSKRIVVILVRYANGVFGSWIAIRGMRVLGLQRLKG
ncbi:hypothetical protein ACHAW5_000667 [Stephanodiscus triporus]|uniref:ADP,ATP carrier protein n=1 Tax=Stephanodiscus triporus TaxID=2934178 RepID=A0ABD3PEZ0_9STRA